MPSPLALALALTLGTPWAWAQAAGDVDARIVQLRGEAQWLPALSLIEAGLSNDPDNDALRRLRILTLADLGAADLAWTLAQRERGLFSDEEHARLDADRIARHATWGDVAPVDETQPYVDMERARAVLDEGHAGTRPEQLPWRQRMDRLVILNGLDRHEDVATDVHALQAQGIELPHYVRHPVGESLLSVRQPEAAVRVLREALAEDPDNTDTVVLLAYALMESGQALQARRLLADEAERQPAFGRVPGAGRTYENWDRYSVDTNLAMIHAYSRDAAGAERMLAPMVALAPNNSDLQAKTGIVAMQRNRPEAGLERLDVALTMDPRNREARIARVDALTRLDRHTEARLAHDALVGTYPGDARVQRMHRDWRRSTGWQGEIAADRGRSDRSGTASDPSPFGSREGGYRVALWSPRLGDHWRLGAGMSERWAEFEGPRVRNRRSGAMLAFARDRLSAELGVDRPLGDGLGSTATSLSGAWRLDDTWRLRGRASHNAADASLQALEAGVRANHWQVGADWAPDERRWAGGDIGQWRFSDGNRRETLAVYAGHWFHVQPRHSWSWDANAGSSRSSLDGAPYFNPSRDAYWNAGLNLEAIGYQRYERSFTQRVGVTVGQYWQDGFGTSPTVSARYRHEWSFASGRRLEYGLSWSRPVYDGNRETRVGIDARLSWGGL